MIIGDENKSQVWATRYYRHSAVSGDGRLLISVCTPAGPRRFEVLDTRAALQYGCPRDRCRLRCET